MVLSSYLQSGQKRHLADFIGPGLEARQKSSCDNQNLPSVLALASLASILQPSALNRPESKTYIAPRGTGVVQHPWPAEGRAS